MPRIVSALFRDRAKAQQGLQTLVTRGIAQNPTTAIGLEEGREISAISGFRDLSLGDEPKAAIRNLRLRDEDRNLFERGLQQGMTLVAARIDRANVAEAIRILGMFDPVDWDRESREWVAAKAAADERGGLAEGITGGKAEGMTSTDALPGMGTLTEETDGQGAPLIR